MADITVVEENDEQIRVIYEDNGERASVVVVGESHSSVESRADQIVETHKLHEKIKQR